MSESKIAVPATESGIHLPVIVVDAFDHMFLYGLASIVEAETGHSVRVHWKSRTEAVLDAGPDLNESELGAIIHCHADRHADSAWLTTVIKLADGNRDHSPLSPRIGKLANRKAFADLEQARRPLIDSLKQEDWLTRRFLGALGRPADWAVNKKTVNKKTVTEIDADCGASAWEMAPRNQGGEFVRTHLLKLAPKVRKRSIEKVTDGLLGRLVSDEAGEQKLDSHTPTGLRAPGPTDNARAWCALWGISLFPVQPVTKQIKSKLQNSTSAGVLRLSDKKTWFFLPVFEVPKTVAGVRVVARSAQLARQAQLAVPGSSAEEVSQTPRDFEWLKERGMTKLVLFEQAEKVNPKGPNEKYAMPGRTVATVRLPQLRSGNRRSAHTYQGARRGQGSQPMSGVI